MNTYKRHRFPPDIISYTVWLYYRFNLSHRDIEDLLAERGITTSRETIWPWCIKFGAIYSRRLKRRHRAYGDTFYIDEVFVKINGKQHYLWRAVDQDGEVVDVYLQARRDRAAAKRFFKRLIRCHQGEPRKIVTDKLRSYGVAHRGLIPETIHSTKQYENNRVEQSYEATRVKERASNQRDKHSDSWVLMPRLVIYSIWGGTWCPPITIEISGSLRSQSGAGRLPETGWRIPAVWMS